MVINYFLNPKMFQTIRKAVAAGIQVNASHNLTTLSNSLVFSSRPFVCNDCGTSQRANTFHTSLPRCRGEDRKQLAASMPKRDEGSSGETSVDIDSLIHSKDDVFPDINLPNRLFDGVPFKEIPIVNIKTTKNNTILTVSDFKGTIKMTTSCGVEGFKNTRKGTNIAAQATSISLTAKMLADGYKNVRVRVSGLGPGRISAIKGLQMGGLNVISITDNTKSQENGPRPRKQRRI